MGKHFAENERRICSYFQEGVTFTYNGNIYKVLENADKPSCPQGEPKTDIFIRTLNMDSGEEYDFKVSYKQYNADFLENKTNAERAELLLGEDWMNIIERSTLNLSDNFENRKLIFKDQQRKTLAGSITLGWRFELLRVESGGLSGEMDLSYSQKIDVYAGTNLPQDKKDSSVNGAIIENSGVAEYVFEEVCPASCVQESVVQFKTIPEYLEEYPDIYYACKALNYRSLEEKYDGPRPLAVFVDWYASNGKLDHNIVYDEPLVITGREALDRLLYALNEIGAENTDDLNPNNVVDYDKIVFERE